MVRGSLLVLLCFCFRSAIQESAPRASSEESWDGPLLPVQNGKVVLPLTCPAEPTGSSDRALGWGDELAPYVYGLRPDDPVIGLGEDGTVEATLGSEACFTGSCGADYVSIELESPRVEGVKPFAVVDASFLDHVTVSSPASVDTAAWPDCSELIAGIAHEYFPELAEERSCEILRLDADRVLQIAHKWFMQENGWPVADVWARVLAEDDNSVRAGVPLRVDYDTNPLTPRLLLVDTDGDTRLLWSKSSGICCPQALTLQMSRVDPSGELVFGRAFTAGGQPCD